MKGYLLNIFKSVISKFFNLITPLVLGLSEISSDVISTSKVLPEFSNFPLTPETESLLFFKEINPFEILSLLSGAVPRIFAVKLTLSYSITSTLPL